MDPDFETKGFIRKYSGNGRDPETIFNSQAKVIGIATCEAYEEIKEMLSNYEEIKEKCDFIPILQFYEDGNFSLSLNVVYKQKGK
jgi:hypothetical protein